MAFTRLTDPEIDRIYDEVNLAGYSRVDGILTPDMLDEARMQAEAAVEGNAGQYISINGSSGLSGELLARLHADPTFMDVCARLYRKVAGSEPRSDDFYQVLRCLKGASARQNSYYLHFDSYVITALIPIAIPVAGETGDLILLGRRRRIRPIYLLSMMEKAILDRKPVQQLLWWLIRRGLLTSIRMNLKVGSLYFFWGYRTLHANEPCDADKLRVTLLLHFGNPHERSRTRALLGQLRRR